ncbi:MAG TPA: hypothetical protein VF595_17280 [Tepidisphaeraceae bacterium]|jgi:hypothetical protein
MKSIVSLVVAATALVCLIAIGLSIIPGVLHDVLFIGFLFSIVVVPVAGGITLVGLSVVWLRGNLPRTRLPAPQLAMIVAMLLGTYALLSFYVPRRFAFIVSQASFDAVARQSTVTSDTPIQLNRRLGLFWVDEYATDTRGGTYFRVYQGGDGIGPDTMSWGFAFQPNAVGTPFGSARYLTRPLGNGWYWFRASND